MKLPQTVENCNTKKPSRRAFFIRERKPKDIGRRRTTFKSTGDIRSLNSDYYIY